MDKTTEYEIMLNYKQETQYMIEIGDTVEYNNKKYVLMDISHNIIGEILCSLSPVSFRDNFEVEISLNDIKLVHKAKKSQRNCECGQWVVKGFTQGPWHSDYCPLYRR